MPEAGMESGIPGGPFEVSSPLAFEILEVLRLTHIYALKDSHVDELPEDFQPHKWTNEVEFAQQSVDVYRRLLDEMAVRDGTSASRLERARSLAQKVWAAGVGDGSRSSEAAQALAELEGLASGVNDHGGGH